MKDKIIMTRKEFNEKYKFVEKMDHNDLFDLSLFIIMSIIKMGSNDDSGINFRNLLETLVDNSHFREEK